MDCGLEPVARPGYVTPCSEGEFVPGFIFSIVAAMGGFFRSRSDTALEGLALRRRLAVLKRKRPRPAEDRRRGSDADPAPTGIGARIPSYCIPWSNPYPASLSLQVMDFKWSHPPGLNRRPADYESAVTHSLPIWISNCKLLFDLQLLFFLHHCPYPAIIAVRVSLRVSLARLTNSN